MNERSTTHAANAMIGEFDAVKTHDDSENLDLVSSNTARRELFVIRGSSSEEKIKVWRKYSSTEIKRVVHGGYQFLHEVKI